jgi:leader peptidase (prepilin peptidase)/N-methyltransferase
VTALIAQTPALWVVLAALLGLLVGSFLNVVIHRLPVMLERDWQAQCAELRNEPLPGLPAYNLVVPRSACPACGHAIPWYENIPLASYALLGGKCSACQAPIARRYPAVEALCGLLTALVAWHFGFAWAAAAAFLLVWTLLALAFIDLDTQYLPDNLTLPLLWAGLLFNLAGGFTDLGSAVIGAAAGYLTLWLVYHLFRMLTGKEGMGYGDFKLLAALGAWFGWQFLPLLVVLSSLAGAVVGISLILLAGHERSKPIPFGPYLVVAGLITLFWGEALLAAYLGP